MTAEKTEEELKNNLERAFANADHVQLYITARAYIDHLIKSRDHLKKSREAHGLAAWEALRSSATVQRSHAGKYYVHFKLKTYDQWAAEKIASGSEEKE